MDNKHNKPVLTIIIPCYNEQEVLPETSKKLSDKLQQLITEEIIDKKSTLLFVDDGSSDNTWSLIEKLYSENPLIFNGLKLSGNKGHQNALLCGLLTVKDYVDVAISIDADLQDDIDVIGKMMEKYSSGYEIVFGVRSNRKTDSFFKRSTAHFFYRFMRFLGVDIIYNHADFRLLGKNALEALSEYGEVNLFLRGIIPMLGFKTDIEYYKRSERTLGISKYTFRKMLQFAFEGITAFSIKPLRLITVLGVLIFTVSVAMIVYFIVNYFYGNTISGWASIACSLWGIGGLILFSIGIVGEYIGKIYLETKRRPRFHIEKYLSKEN